MTALSLNAGALRTAGRAVPFFGVWRRERHATPMLLAGVSLLALATAGHTSPVEAASFTAANETELNAALSAAQASADPTSTITLTGSFTISAPTAAIAGKQITIETGANTLTLGSGNSFDVAADASLTISGQILGTGIANTDSLIKEGSGDLVVDGVTGSSLVRIGLEGGTTTITGGSEVTFGASGGTLPQLRVAYNSGEIATLTISGEGTLLNGTGTQSMDFGNSSGLGLATLNVVDGGALEGASSSIRLAGRAALNVSGEGSAIRSAGLFQLNGTHTIKVTDGGLFDVSGIATLGGVGNNAQGWVDAEVSGAGSKFEATTLYMQRGSLSVLDGGVVEATTVNAATATGGSPSDFDILVSGTGSELRATNFTLATRGIGVLTIANDGKVTVNDGNSALTLGGALPASQATLNIGAAEGEAAAAAGTLDASAITLAASAEINFNHTEAGYVFDVPINGSGAINQVAGRTIFNADQLGFAGLTTISGGMLEVNGALGGTVDVTGGTLAGTGTVGTASLATGGAIAPGSNGIGTLTIDGDYTGSGGLLQIETVLGGDGSDTDLLRITGATSGTTNVRVTNMGGVGGLTGDAGIKIVDVGGASDGTFSLLGDVVVDGQQAVIGGAYLYGLHQGTLTDADGDWYLRSILDPDDDTPIFQPAAPVIETYAAAALQSFNTTETLQQRVGNRSWSDGGVEGNGIWGRIDARRTSLDPESSTTGASYDVSTWRLQAGLDGVLSQSEAGTIVGGVNLQVGTVAADIGSVYGAGGIASNAYGIGATLTWYGKEGFYLDAQGKLNWFDSTLSVDLLDSPLVAGNAGFGYALSLEAGQQLALGNGWSVTPQAQLSYSDVAFDAFDSFGSTVALHSGDSLAGRLGVSADYETEWQDTDGGTGRTHLYGIANLTYEFLDGTATGIGDDTLVNESDPLWGGIGLGGSLNWADDRLSLYGEASLNTSLNSPGDSFSIGATAGIRGKL